jgi:hypothetical protein
MSLSTMRTLKTASYHKMENSYRKTAYSSPDWRTSVSFSFWPGAKLASFALGPDMTMQRSECTDPDASQRFPVSLARSTTGDSTGTAVADMLMDGTVVAGGRAAAIATQVHPADVLSGRGKSHTKHNGNLRFDGKYGTVPACLHDRETYYRASYCTLAVSY